VPSNIQKINLTLSSCKFLDKNACVLATTITDFGQIVNEKLMRSLKKMFISIIGFQGTFGGRQHPRPTHKAHILREKQSSLSHFPPSKVESQRLLEGCHS